MTAIKYDIPRKTKTHLSYLSMDDPPGDTAAETAVCVFDDVHYNIHGDKESTEDQGKHNKRHDHGKQFVKHCGYGQIQNAPDIFALRKKFFGKKGHDKVVHGSTSVTFVVGRMGAWLERRMGKKTNATK